MLGEDSAFKLPTIPSWTYEVGSCGLGSHVTHGRQGLAVTDHALHIFSLDTCRPMQCPSFHMK